MKITQVTISHGITVNFGNNESERYDVTLTAETDSTNNHGVDELFLEAGRLLALQLSERLDDARIERIKAVSATDDRRLKALDREPEFIWIKRLHPEYAHNIEAEVVRGASLDVYPGSGLAGDPTNSDHGDR